MKSTLLALVLLLGLNASAWADRIKDLASVAAGRTNQLIGYGLVVGLQGTGDGSDVSFTAQSMKSMLSRMGVSLDGPLSDFEQGTTAGKIDIKNVAAVMVTAELPPFAKPGQRIDINVSAIGKATNLRGGNLLLTSLRGVDGEVYGIAQGALTATGIDANAAGSKVSIGVPTSARVPNGATVERMVETPFESSDHVVMNVRESDFTTTTAIVNAVNKSFGEGTARAIDGMSLAIRAPTDMSQRVAFMSMVENLDVVPGEPPARVVINSRTGTVVISRNVRVTAAAVAHGTISVAISATNEVSQPNPLAQGQTAPVENAQIAVNEPKNPMFLFQPGVDLRQVVDAVNQVGATPSALIAILEALKSTGSLRAELIII
ncbi:flagellar basal body P-ring protein FlgI [Limnohabitans sp. 2KL-51]|uniref:flagellar basal body P-ring protein FlgI n=1 Tax=Limnohabitans sp. 2KL-51 TaxID=1977911 RepID=UPI000D34CEC3|nr:flagellar basal body P-ring protein FlgI [Limnohabitans sp. 2KL-51]PUE51615.1 flagellar biosynthesis protein FlgI [Limnohabitans sp. 2KL-51]